MKIKQIRVVELDLPVTPPKSRPTRPAANKVSARRALPINYYPEFTPESGQMPGATAAVAWVRCGLSVRSIAMTSMWWSMWAGA